MLFYFFVFDFVFRLKMIGLVHKTSVPIAKLVNRNTNVLIAYVNFIYLKLLSFKAVYLIGQFFNKC